MISIDEIKSCTQIQVTGETPSTLEIMISTVVFVDGVQDVTISISIPKVGDSLVITESSVKVFGQDMAEMSIPVSWDPKNGLAKTLETFIAANKAGQVEQKSEEDVMTELAIARVRANVKAGSDFIAQTLFFYLRGLDDDTIDRAKAGVINQITESIIEFRQKYKQDAGRSE
jgi:hypothetical protein